MSYEARDAPGPATLDSRQRFLSYLTWGVRELAIGLIVVVSVVFIVSLAIVAPVAAEYGEDTPETYFAAAVAALIWDAGFVLTAFWVVRRTGGSWANLGFRSAWFGGRDLYESLRRSVPLPKLAVAVVAGYILSYAAVYAYAIIVYVIGADFLEPSEQLPEALFDETAVVAMTGFAVVVGAPVAEEVLFRGFLFAGLRRYLSFWPAALISGAIFSLAHFNVGLVIPFMLVGAVLAYTYERSGTLFASIAVHLLFNLTSFSLLVFFPELR